MFSEFHQLIDNFINAKIEINDLVSWYSARLPELLANPNSIEAEIIAEVEFEIEEIKAKRATLEDLRNNLSQIIFGKSSYVENFTKESIQISTTASNLYNINPVLFDSRFQDFQPLMFTEFATA